MSTLISWSDEVWNPTTGCDRVSPGCANCYAMHLAARYRHNPKMQERSIYQKDGGRASGPGFGLTLRPEVLEKPLHWKRPRRVFVNSMSDLFHDEVPFEYIDRVFAVMALAPQHTFQCLTKRIERAASYLAEAEPRVRALLRLRGPHLARDEARRQPAEELRGPAMSASPGGIQDSRRIPENLATHLAWPMPNVLIGPTVENQAMANKRLPVLAQLHAGGWRTMVSAEPLLGPVDFRPWLEQERHWPASAYHNEMTVLESCIAWLIVGGESGPGRRPFDHEWARGVLRQARAAGVPCFVKQDGAYKSEQYDSLPDDLKLREFPTMYCSGHDDFPQAMRDLNTAFGRVKQERGVAG